MIAEKNLLLIQVITKPACHREFFNNTIYDKFSLEWFKLEIEH